MSGELPPVRPPRTDASPSKDRPAARRPGGFRRRARELSFGLPRTRRLRSRRDFTRVERQGLRVGAALLGLTVRAGNGRVGLAVSKKVGNAVVRNRVKRALREWMRHHKALWRTLDVVIGARPEAATATREALGAQLQQLLQTATQRLSSSPASSSSRAPPRPAGRGHGPSQG